MPDNRSVQIDGYEPVDVEKLKSFFQDPAGNFHSYFAVASNHRFQPRVASGRPGKSPG